MAFAFEKLNVYQKSISFADAVCTLTKGFPRGYFFLAGRAHQATSIDLRVANAIPSGLHRKGGPLTLRVNVKGGGGLLGGSYFRNTNANNSLFLSHTGRISAWADRARNVGGRLLRRIIEMLAYPPQES